MRMKFRDGGVRWDEYGQRRGGYIKGKGYVDYGNELTEFGHNLINIYQFKN